MSKDTTGAYIALGAAATAYAAALSTDAGRKFADDYTWASVVVGVGLVLGVLRGLLPRRYWELVAWAFVVAGVPMIARSLLQDKGKNEEN